MRIYHPKNELGQSILNEGQLVKSTTSITKSLTGGAITLTDADIAGISKNVSISDWQVKSVNVTIDGSTFSFMPDVTMSSSEITIRLCEDGKTIDGLTSAKIVLQLIDAQGIALKSDEVELSIDILIAQAKVTGDNSALEVEIDKAIAGGSKDEIQALGAKLADSGIEDYSLAGAKTATEAKSIMTTGAGNMGAFSSPIMNGNQLVDTDFRYNMMSLEDGIFLFLGSNITSFETEIPSLSDATDMFENCTGLTSWTVDLPDSLTRTSAMFYGCTGLTSFEAAVPNSLTSADSMFQGCYNLTFVNPKNCSNSSTLNQIIESLPEYEKADGTHMILFSTGDELLNASLTATALLRGWDVGTDDDSAYYYYGEAFDPMKYAWVTDGYCMFYNDTSLTEWNYELPNLTNAPFMFQGCSGLTSWNVALPDSLYEVSGMFWGCTGLTEWTVDLPNSLTNADSMFRECTGLTEWTVDLPDSLTSAYSMFRECTGLTEWTVNLPDSLTEANYMFNGCTGLTSWTVTLPDSLKHANSMFYGCSGLTEWTVALPQSLTNATGMFYICKLNLTSVQKIAETIPTMTDGKTHFISIGMGCTQATFNDHNTGWYDAIETIKTKGWTVSVQYIG